MSTHVIPQDSLKRIRQIADEMEKARIVSEALYDKLLKELFVDTGVDMHNQDCDLDTERGILTCKDSEPEGEEVELDATVSPFLEFMN